MPRTARELIIDAYRTASIVPDNDTPTGNELEIGLKELNGIINVLNVDNLWPYTNLIVPYNFIYSLSSATSLYTHSNIHWDNKSTKEILSQ